MSRDDLCHCCDTVSATPVELYNRPGLSAIAYRVGDFGQFRQAMLQDIAGQPALRDFASRASDDYAVSVLEAWAAVGDILSFYQERTANEAYLRTAVLRGSLQRLAGLLGYQLNPGLAATAWLAFQVEGGKQLEVPVGLRVQSVPEQNEKPQKYETLEAIQAYGWLNRLTAYPAPVGTNPLVRGRSWAYLAPEADGLAALQELAEDDRLLLFDLSAEPEELQVKELQGEGEQLRLSWQRPIQGEDWDLDSRLYKRDRSFRLFGYNAAVGYPKADESGGLLLWKLKTITTGTAPAGQESFYVPGPNQLYLDSLYDDLEVGSRLLMQVGSTRQQLLTITGLAQAEQTLGNLTDTVTRITVTPDFSQIDDRRQVVLHELLGEPIRFWGYQYPARADGDCLYVPGRRIADGQLLLGRELKRRAYSAGEQASIAQLDKNRRVLVTAVGAKPASAKLVAARIVEREICVSATADDPYSAGELRLDAAGGQTLRGLCSAPLADFDGLGASAPTMRLRLEGANNYLLQLGASVTTLSLAADRLQAAIRAIDVNEPLFSQARVLVSENRLLVLFGKAEANAAFEPSDEDETSIAELGLLAEQVRPLTALLSGPLGGVPVFSSLAPQLSVSIGPSDSHTLTLASAYPSLNNLAESLQALLRLADPAPVFRYARVLLNEGRLLIIPDRLGLAPRSYLRLELQPDGSIDFAPRPILQANVALASHGETQKEEILGDGDPSEPFQQFTLKKAPLTYTPSAASSGGDCSLQVLVNGMLWQEVDSLYARAAIDTVYVTRVDDEGRTIIRFGDGINGARLPAGRGNVVARYRQGLGLHGRVGSESIRNALDKPKGLKSVLNPAAAEGGADPESLEEARKHAPTTVRTFGRAVSLLDLEDLLKDSGEVAKAKAGWVWIAGRRTAHLTLAGQGGALFSPTALTRLHAGLAAQRDPNRPLRLDNYLPLAIEIAATLTVDAAYVASQVAAAARGALLDALSFEIQAFGQPVHLSDIHAVLQGVDGVTSVDVDRLMFKRPVDVTEAAFQDFLDSRAVLRLADGTAADLQPHLRIYPARPDRSAVPWVRPAEQAYLEQPDQNLLLLTRGGLSG